MKTENNLIMWAYETFYKKRNVSTQNGYIHTHIIIYYNPSIKITISSLTSHTKYILCVNFIDEYWDQQIFGKLYYCFIAVKLKFS